MSRMDEHSSPKIRGRHLDRLAIVYVRQSTPHQVAEHRESADLQYQLQQRAAGLGWSQSRVVVIDKEQSGILPVDSEGRSVINHPRKYVVRNRQSDVHFGAI